MSDEKLGDWWIESHQALRDHPKTRRLMRALQLTRKEAIGTLHLFWWWCIDFAEDGDITRYDADDLADAADWDGDSTLFVQAMDKAGFIGVVGDRLVVHDWHQYAGKLIEVRKKRREYMRKYRAEKAAAADQQELPLDEQPGDKSATNGHVTPTYEARDDHVTVTWESREPYVSPLNRETGKPGDPETPEDPETPGERSELPGAEIVEKAASPPGGQEGRKPIRRRSAPGAPRMGEVEIDPILRNYVEGREYPWHDDDPERTMLTLTHKWINSGVDRDNFLFKLEQAAEQTKQRLMSGTIRERDEDGHMKGWPYCQQALDTLLYEHKHGPGFSIPLGKQGRHWLDGKEAAALPVDS